MNRGSRLLFRIAVEGLGPYDQMPELSPEAISSINTLNEQGFTPLHLTCHNDDETTAKSLLRLGADPNLPEPSRGYYPLHTAIRLLNRLLVRMLLDQGALHDVRDKLEETPLICACRWGDVEIVGMLLDAGVDLGAWNYHGLTPLMVAEYEGHEDVVRLLIERGASAAMSHHPTSSSLLPTQRGHLPVAAKAHPCRHHQGQAAGGGGVPMAMWDPLFTSTFKQFNSSFTSTPTSVANIDPIEISSNSPCSEPTLNFLFSMSLLSNRFDLSEMGRMIESSQAVVEGCTCHSAGWSPVCGRTIRS